MRELVGAATKSAAATIAAGLLSACTSKALAVFSGTGGVGLYSLARQLHHTLVSLGSFGGQTAVVQGLSATRDAERDMFLATVCWLYAIGAALVAAFLLAFPGSIARAVLGASEPGHARLVALLAISCVSGVVLSFANGVMASQLAVGRVALSQVICGIVAVAVALPASPLIAAGYPEAVGGILGLSFLGGAAYSCTAAARAGWFGPLASARGVVLARSALRRFFAVASATSLAGLAQTGTLLLVRGTVQRRLGLEGAGHFDAGWSLSMVYIALALSSFSTYYLPKLAGEPDSLRRRAIVSEVMRFTVLAMVPLVVGVMVFKPLAVSLLYSREFLPALDMVRWMLIGDYVKAAGWVLGVPLVALGAVRVHFWAEIAWAAGLLAITALPGGAFSLERVGMAYAALYAAYLAFVGWYSGTRLGVGVDRVLMLRWGAGFALVGVAAAATWSQRAVHWPTALALMLAALAYSWSGLSRGERLSVVGRIRRLADR